MSFMKIISLKIDGFRGDKEIEFFPGEQISVITGSNGSGKTNIIKMIWSILSGNIIIALREIPFSSATLTTTEYKCKVIRTGRLDCIVEYSKKNKPIEIFRDNAFEDDDGDKITIETAEDQAASVITKEGSSLFFPTFRRIEGGFGISSGNKSPFYSTGDSSEIDEAFSGISKRLTNGNHQFITSISAQDVSNMSQKLFLELSARTNKLQENMSKDILKQISSYGDHESGNVKAEDILKSITRKVEGTKELQRKILGPVEEINKTIKFIFQSKGDEFVKNLSFGKSLDKSIIDRLSSGEKQFLGFIAYNAMYKNSIILIDEPELSLHTDWQRQLFPVLLRQNPTNQFIVSTHSPLIYSKYPESEFEVN